MAQSGVKFQSGVVFNGVERQSAASWSVLEWFRVKRHKVQSRLPLSAVAYSALVLSKVIERTGIECSCVE